MRLTGHVEKGWGSEEIWATNDKYCAKFLHFNKNAKFSMHLHSQKDETWYVLCGSFLLKYVDTQTAKIVEKILNKGDVWHNPPMLPHQLICIEQGTIVEVSTPDSVEDNYRIAPGDSQIG